jgi:hypothetical protein
MDVKLIRRDDDGKATLSELHWHPGPKHMAYTLEPAWRDNERRASCIPPGTYPLRIRTEGGFFMPERNPDG